MNYKIVKKDGFAVVGKSMRVSTVNQDQLKTIPRFWAEACRAGTVGKLTDIAANGADGQTNRKLLGICTDFNDNNEFSYVIAVESTAKEEYAGFEVFPIPPADWGVFEATGPMPGAIQELFKRIYTEFFRLAAMKGAEGPDLEIYYEGDIASPDYRSEIWIPVVKQAMAGAKG